ADRHLAAESIALQLPQAQAAPQLALRIGHGPPQFAGAVALLALAHPCAPGSCCLAGWGGPGSGDIGDCGSRLSGSTWLLHAPTPALPAGGGGSQGGSRCYCLLLSCCSPAVALQLLLS